METLLVEYVLDMENKFYGLTRADVMSMAYQLMKVNNLPNSFSDVTQSAGKKWLSKFLKRHGNLLSVRKPTGTSFARAKGFNKESVGRFFDLLMHEFENHMFPSDRVYNVDESGLSVVQSKIPHVIGRKGKRQIGSMTSAERGSLVTGIFCMSASGTFIPPFLIFPRKKFSPQLMKGAPVGSVGICHPSGWVQTYIFTDWFKHFISKTKPSKEDPVLLILDGHYSHTKNIELIDLARKHYVSILSLPPHTTHKMQPLDKTYMGSLKAKYSEEVRRWIMINGRPVTHFDLAEIFGKAYLNCQTASIAINGFRATGIYPPNPNIFPDCEYEAAEMESLEESGCSSSHITGDTSPRTTLQQIIQQSPIASGSGRQVITPKQLRPAPKHKKKMGKQRGRPPGVAEKITSTPYKDALSAKKSIQPPKRTPKVLFPSKKFGKPSTSSSKKGSTKKEKELSDDSSDSDVVPLDNDSLNEIDDEDNATVVEDDVICIFCDRKFSEDNKGEEWIMCIMCQTWCHEVCSGAINKKHFVCDYCNN